MTRWGELTSATILQIAHEVREGEADPEDARRLIELFCKCSDENSPAELLQHLRSAFSAYLTGKRSIESALGLVRKTGRPEADEEIRQTMAAEILRLRLSGESHQDSLATISDKFGWGQSIIGEAWRDNKQTALILLRLERCEEQRPWTPDEAERLKDIFKNEPWLAKIKFLTPENSANKPT